MNPRKHPFGSTQEAILYPVLLLAIMWLAHWADYIFPQMYFYRYVVQPGEIETLLGLFFMPLIHSKNGFEHIINNSIPTAVLLGALVYYYRRVALRVFLISWFFTGLGLWLFATDSNSYHIGMSGVVYALAGFLFTSGVMRKYLPLQAISLFVAFMYGSMIWGIFPTESHVSWEGHLSGLISGIVLAIIYRKLGPQAPKYQYEVEKELGIEPPDLEGQWRERVQLEKERLEAIEALKKAQEEAREKSKETRETPRSIYQYKPKNTMPPDENAP